MEFNKIQGKVIKKRRKLDQNEWYCVKMVAIKQEQMELNKSGYT